MYDDEDESYLHVNKDWKYYFVKYVFVIILFMFWIVYKGRLGIVTYDKATMMMVGGVVMYTFGASVWYYWKHKTAKIIWNYGFSTTTGKWIPAGNYAIFRLGAVDALGIKMEGREGCMICPLDAVNKFGGSVANLVKGDPVPFDKLPEDVQNEIAVRGLKGPYVLGFADAEQYEEEITDDEKTSGLSRPNVAGLIALVKSQNERITQLNNFLDAKFKTYEDVMKFVERSKERLSGAGWKATKKALFGTREDEE